MPQLDERIAELESSLTALKDHMEKFNRLVVLVEQLKANQAPVAAPVEAAVEAAVEAQVEAPVEAQVEVPVEVPAEVPVEVPVEAPVAATLLAPAQVEDNASALEEIAEVVAESAAAQDGLAVLKSVVKMVKLHKNYLDEYFSEGDAVTDHNVLLLTYDFVQLINAQLEQLSQNLF